MNIYPIILFSYGAISAALATADPRSQEKLMTLLAYGVFETDNMEKSPVSVVRVWKSGLLHHTKLSCISLGSCVSRTISLLLCKEQSLREFEKVTCNSGSMAWRLQRSTRWSRYAGPVREWEKKIEYGYAKLTGMQVFRKKGYGVWVVKCCLG